MRFDAAFPDRIDIFITSLIRKLWTRSYFMDAGMIVIAKWTPMFMLLLIAMGASGLLLNTETEHLAFVDAFVSVVAAVVGRVLNEPITQILPRHRPFEQSGFIPLLLHQGGDSFPSNHTTGAFALAVGSSFVPGYGPVLLFLAVLLGFSRIYCGLHHASDVFFGALNGVLIASVIGFIPLFQKL